VKSAQWSVATHELALIFDENKTSLDSIAKKVADVGHDSPEFTAPDQAYDKVSPCCKYRDDEVIKAHQ
jgi:periplasmic mercuric ion binding protein